MDARIYLRGSVAMTPKNTGDRPDRLLRQGDRRSVAPGRPINGVAILLPLAFALHLPAESALILLWRRSTSAVNMAAESRQYCSIVPEDAAPL